MAHDPLDLGGQERASDERKLRADLDSKNEDDDFMWLMSSKRGRRIVWRSLERAGVFKLTFNTDAMLMAFAEGGRNEGLRTMAQIHALCPGRYQEMADEARADARAKPKKDDE